ncbi:DNA polymerase III subunit beta [Metabacillus halosaccharovorans]|nr:DNA polymerase III subunit beta [Metabacillus halosaccharovorans]
MRGNTNFGQRWLYLCFFYLGGNSMKIEIKKDTLLDALNKVIKVISTKASLPILQGILFEIEKDEIRLTASDHSNTIQHRIPADGEALDIIETGKVVIPAKMFIEIVKKSKKSITLTLNNLVLSYKSGRSQMELNCLDSNEYPNLPEIDAKIPLFSLKGNQFNDCIKKTVFAASESETRPILQGVLFDIRKDSIHLISTDSHRLGSVNQKWSNQEEQQFVVPAKALDNISKSFDILQDVEVFATQQMLLLKNGQTIFYSRLLEGNYPDTSRLIPQDFKSEVTLNRTELLDSIDRIKTLASSADNNKSSIIKMHVNGVVSVSTHQTESGKGKDEVVYSNLNGEDDFTISFTGKYVIDALKALDCEEVVFKYQDSMRPFLLIPSEQKDLDEIQLILPVRTY